MEQSSEESRSGFVQIALQLGLLSDEQAEAIRRTAVSHVLGEADAALSLEALSPLEVVAIRLLQRPDCLAPGYRLTGLIGCGASGIVFRARQSKLDRDVAIKTISTSVQSGETNLRRLQREARVIAKLSHPNIVSAYDCGFHEGRFFIAMELVEGQDLAAYINDSPRLSEAVVWSIARQVASALAHASELNLIHRDIKPANILLTQAPAGSNIPDGVPFAKVADFGLAFSGAGFGEGSLTAQGVTLGTPAYVAPEQLQDSHVDQRADIYSLGATVFHMFCGFPPFVDRKPMQIVIDKTVGDDLWRSKLIDGLSEASRQLFRDMTEPDVAERISDYQELMRRIDAVPNSNSNEVCSTKLGDTIETSRVATHASPQDLRWLSVRSLALIGVFLTMVALAYIGWTSHWVTTYEPKFEVTAWETMGPTVPLFNGVEVPVDFDRRGLWTPHLSEEGSVLIAKQGAWMEIPLADQRIDSPVVRLRVGLRLVDDAVAELRFLTANEQQSLAVRISNDSARLVELSSLPNKLPGSVEKKLNPAGEINTPFHVCQLIASGADTTVAVDGTALGTIAIGTDQNPSVRISAEEGTVEFADLEIVGVQQTPIE